MMQLCSSSHAVRPVALEFLLKEYLWGKDVLLFFGFLSVEYAALHEKLVPKFRHKESFYSSLLALKRFLLLRQRESVSVIGIERYFYE